MILAAKIVLGLALLGMVLTWVVRYGIRAIDEKRPGWVTPEEEEFVLRCPLAEGHKGDPGTVGKKES